MCLIINHQLKVTWCLKENTTFVPIWLWFYFVLDLQLTLNFQTYLITCRSFSSKHVISEIVEPPRIFRAFAWLQLQLCMDQSLKTTENPLHTLLYSTVLQFVQVFLNQTLPNTGLTKQLTTGGPRLVRIHLVQSPV